MWAVIPSLNRHIKITIVKMPFIKRTQTKEKNKRNIFRSLSVVVGTAHVGILCADGYGIEFYCH